MIEDNTQVPRKQWYVAKWPPLAWLETGIKLVALAIGLLAFFEALSAGEFALPSGLRLAQLLVMALLSLGLVAAILDRLVEREVVAMVIVILNNLGHWGMTMALASVQDLGSSLIAFAALMLVGDLVKLLFLKLHDFQVRDTPRGVLYGLTAFYTLGYATLLILELMR
jgi:hypothetical protein